MHGDGNGRGTDWPPDGDVVTYTNNTNAGTATASATYPGNATYATSSGSTTFIINAAPVTATAGSYSGVYDGLTHSPSPACAVTGAYTTGLACTNTPTSVGPAVGSGAVTPTVTGNTQGNFTVTPVNGSWSITTASSTVTVSCIPSSVVYNGLAQTPSCMATVTGAGGLNQPVTPVTYANNTNVGTATASATFAGDANHTTSSGSTTFTITAAPVTATAGSYTGVFDGNPHSPSPACVVAGAYTTGLTCTNTPSSVGPAVGSGTVTPTVTGNTQGNFTVTPINGTWSITSASATPTVTTVICPPSPVVYNGAPQTPSCTATVTGAGLTGPQTVTWNYANNTNAGTATASATYAGDATYGASTGSATFTITPAPVTATAGSYNGVFDGNPHSPSPACVVAGAYTAGLACTNTPSSVGPAVGSGTVTPTVTGNTQGNFTVTPINGTWSITSASATPTTTTVICPLSVVYNGAPQAPCTATVAGSGLTGPQTVTWSYTPQNTNVGTVTASATYAGNATYGASSGSATFTITPAPVTATAGSYNGVFDGNPHSPSPACVVAGAYTGSLACANNPLSVGPAVGSGTVTPTVSGDTLTNFAINAFNGTWSITSASATPTTTTVSCPPSVVYNGAAQSPCMANVTGGGAGGLNQSLTVTYTPQQDINVGTVTASASYAGNATYAASNGSANFTITQAAATVNLVNLAQYYTGSPLPVTVTTTPPGLSVTVLYSSASYPSSQTAPTQPGIYTVTATVVDPNYAGAATGTLVIYPASATGLTLALRSGMPEPSPYGTMAYFDLGGLSGTPCPTGIVQFYVDGAAAGSLVTLSASSCSSPVTFQTATLDPGSHTVFAIYSGDTVHAGGTSNTVTHAVTADTTAVTLAASATTVNVGQPVTFTATVTPSSTPDPSAHGPAGTVEFFDGSTSLGVVTLSSSSPYTAALTTSSLTTGSHSISATYTSSDGEFTTGSSSAILVLVVAGTQGKIAPTINWANPANIVYGTALSATQLNATATDATNGNTAVAGAFAYTPPAGTVLPVGTVNLQATFTPSDTATYSTQMATVTLTVTAAPLTVTASSTTVVYGSAVPTITPIYSGFVNGDTSSVVTTPPTCTTSYTVTSAVGSSPSTSCSGASAANYSISYVSGSVTVTGGSGTPTTTTVSCPASVVYNGAAQTPCTATVTGAGLTGPQTVTWSYTPQNVNVGTVTASASFAGNATYAASNGSATFTINAAAVTATAGSYSGAYDGLSHAPSACAVTGASTSGLTCTNNPSTVGPAVGSGTVTPSVSGGTPANFTITAVNGSWSIAQATSTVTVTCPASIVYNSAAQTPCTATATGAGGLSQPLTVSYTPQNINVGTVTASASFAGNTTYAASSGSANFTIAKAGTSTTVTASSSSVAPGQSVTLTAQVVSVTAGTPTGSVAFYDGTTLLGTVPLTAGTATITTSSLTAGAINVLNAVYSGDNNFTTSQSSTSVTVASLDFTLVVSGLANLTVNPGDVATYQVTADPLYGNYPGPVSFTASGLPSGATVTFSPSTILANGGKQTVTVTVTTPAVAELVSPSIGRRLAPLTLALLLFPLLGVGRLRRQGRRLSRLASLVLLLLGCTLAGAMMTGCGSPSGSGFFTQAQQNYTINVTATSGNVQHAAAVTLLVK